MAKAKQFDFNKELNKLLQRASEKNLDDDLVFQTCITEFKRLKELCDRIWQEIDASDVYLEYENSSGDRMVKANPLVQQYNQTTTNLVKCASSIKDYIESINLNDDDDDYAL